MNVALSEFLPAIPEIFVLSMACVVLLVDLVVSDRARVVTYLLTLITLAVAAILTLNLSELGSRYVLNGTFVSDGLSDVLKLFVYLISSVAIVYSRDYLIERNLFKGEYYVLALFAVLGMMIMISAHNMLTIYLGLELLSLCLYAMVAINRDSGVATEAAMKYFILGALASGMLLYGMSMIYGVTGSLDITTISSTIASGKVINDTVLLFGVVFVIVGLAFKLGAVPFHMWIPDVYHGAPTSVTLFISTAPKIAAFAMMMRLLVEGLGNLHADWQELLIVLAILSMAIGNIIAIAQTNFKRMLAYSAISHVGFILLGILSGTVFGYSAAMFYTIVYAIMGLGGFGMIILLSRAGFEADNLDDLKGLNERSPWFAFIMLIVMFSMAGVPPTVGFYAKLAVLQSVVQVDLVWLAIIAVVFSIIGAFYYLRIIKLMYFDSPIEMTALQASLDMKATISANGLAILALGIYPAGLMGVCMSVLGQV